MSHASRSRASPGSVCSRLRSIVGSRKTAYLPMKYDAKAVPTSSRVSSGRTVRRVATRLNSTTCSATSSTLALTANSQDSRSSAVRWAIAAAQKGWLLTPTKNTLTSSSMASVGSDQARGLGGGGRDMISNAGAAGLNGMSRVQPKRQGCSEKCRHALSRQDRAHHALRRTEAPAPPGGAAAAVAPSAQLANAAIPVIARPRISAWMSCVPS